jgi:hypothetical protein
MLSPPSSDWRRISKGAGSDPAPQGPEGYSVAFDGDHRQRCLENQIPENDLGDNIQILGSFQAEKIPFFAIADVPLITLRDEQIFALAVSSKPLTHLAWPPGARRHFRRRRQRIGCRTDLAQMAMAMTQTPRGRLDAFGNAALEYHQHELNRDQWMDRPVRSLHELSSPHSRNQP